MIKLLPQLATNSISFPNSSTEIALLYRVFSVLIALISKNGIQFYNLKVISFENQ